MHLAAAVQKLAVTAGQARLQQQSTGQAGAVAILQRTAALGQQQAAAPRALPPVSIKPVTAQPWLPPIMTGDKKKEEHPPAATIPATVDRARQVLQRTNQLALKTTGDKKKEEHPPAATIPATVDRARQVLQRTNQLALKTTGDKKKEEHPPAATIPATVDRALQVEVQQALQRGNFNAFFPATQLNVWIKQPLVIAGGDSSKIELLAIEPPKLQVPQIPGLQQLFETDMEHPFAWKKERFILTQPIPDHTMSVTATRISKVIGFLPFVGSLIGMYRIYQGIKEYKSFKSQGLYDLSQRSIQWIVRGVLETIPFVGMVCIVIDIAATIFCRSQPYAYVRN